MSLYAFEMRCSKVEAAVLAGVGVFLVGTACLIAVDMHYVIPAQEEQKFKEINCTIASGNMNAKAKCSNNKNDDHETSYPCLRIYVLCGHQEKSNGLLQNEKPRLLSKDFHGLDKQVRLSIQRSFIVLFKFIV